MPETTMFAVPDPDPLYSAEQAALAFGMKHRTWRRLFDTRAVPLVRIGRWLYVRRSDAVAYLAANTIPARPADDTNGRPE